MRKRKKWLLPVILLSIVIIFAVISRKPDIHNFYLKNINHNNVADTSATAREKRENAINNLRKLFPQNPLKVRADSIVNFAMKYLGKPYVSAGRDSCGFDCSGFVYFVFKHFGIDLPPQSTLIDGIGEQVPLKKARKGDILVFTGINSKIRNPGHVGIVITDNGGAVQFIHSSSYEGVKISQVDSTNYENRYLSCRRVLK